jgi:hypothetical protein
MRRTAKKTYIVYSRTSGGAYLTERAIRVPGANFRWAKNRTIATRLSKETAVKVACRYGGVAVRV